MTYFFDYKIAARLMLICFMTSSCSSEHNQQLTENIQLEFELTYRYVVENMPTDSDYSEKFAQIKSSNSNAFTSIAYTWHSLALDACDETDTSQQTSTQTSYERMLKQSPVNSHLAKKIHASSRPCLAHIYFKNWLNIQNMLLLNFPNIK